jgi:cytochrome c2
MKKGEKFALGFVVVMMAAVIGLTTLLEIERSEKEEAGTGEPDSQARAQRARLIPTGWDISRLPEPESRGAKALNLYCVQCHELPPPSMHTPDEWSVVIVRMEEYMQERGGGMIVRILVPGEPELAALDKYLRRHAQQPLVAANYSDLVTAEGQTFVETCSQCHAAPEPTQHTASEWRRVVARMKVNMTNIGMPVPDAETIDAVLAFLGRHAGGQ